MSPIELTDLHKFRLLEMCIVLFPEYNRIEISDYQIDVDRNHYNPIFIDIYKGDLTVPFDIYGIHWFEFCCNTLVNKLFDNSFDFGKIYYEILKSDNPIDYLYEQFKQLK